MKKKEKLERDEKMNVRTKVALEQERNAWIHKRKNLKFETSKRRREKMLE